MEFVQILPWLLFAAAVVIGSVFAVRASERSRQEALRAQQEAEAARRADFEALQKQLAELREPSKRESMQLAEIIRELTALRERVSTTGAELSKLHDHDREIRTLMSSLLARAKNLANDDETTVIPTAKIKGQGPSKGVRDALSATDSLHLAFLKEQEDQLEKIRKKSQRLNLNRTPETAAAKDRARQTEAVFEAIRGGDLEGMKNAIKLGGEVNGVDFHNGFTPLHLAAREGNVELVAELLALGADAAATDNFGKTPMRVAEEVANGPCVEVLQQAEYG